MTGSAQFQAGNFGGTGKARVLWFDSVAEARNTPNLFSIATSVIIKNLGTFFAAPNDSTTIDDGAHAFAVNGVSVGRFIFSTGSSSIGVDVLGLDGLTGTGTISDPWNFQNVTWKAHTTYNFPAGHYISDGEINFGLYDGIRLIGSGEQQTFIHGGANYCLKFAADSNAVDYDKDPIYSEISGFTFEGNNVTGIGLYIFRAIGCKFEALQFHNIVNTCVDIWHTMGCTFKRLTQFSLDIRPNNPAKNGIVLQDYRVGPTLLQNTVNTFDACWFYKCTEKGLWIRSAFSCVFLGGAFEASGQNNLVIDNTSIGAQPPFNSNNQFIGVDFEGGNGQLLIGGADNFFSGNSCPSTSGIILRGRRNVFFGGTWPALTDLSDDSKYDITRFNNGSGIVDCTAANRFEYNATYTSTDGAAHTLDASGSGAGLTFILPRDTIYRIKATVSAYCKSGPHYGSSYVWKLDYTYRVVGGVVSLVINESPAAAPPNGWLASFVIYGAVATHAVVCQVTGATGDAITWKLDAQIEQNGGLGEIVSPEQRIVQIVQRYGGWWYRASTATLTNMGGGRNRMNLPDSAGLNNAASFYAAPYTDPTLGTLTTGGSPAIVLVGSNAFTPGAIGGTSGSHTCLVVGEPSGAPNYGGLLWIGSPAIAFNINFSQYRTLGPHIGAPGDLITDQVQTTALQTLEFNLDDAGNTAKIFRDGTQLKSVAYSVSQTFGADYVGVFGAATGSHQQYGAIGKYSDHIYTAGSITSEERAIIMRALRDINPSIP